MTEQLGETQRSWNIIDICASTKPDSTDSFQNCKYNLCLELNQTNNCLPTHKPVVVLSLIWLELLSQGYCPHYPELE